MNELRYASGEVACSGDLVYAKRDASNLWQITEIHAKSLYGFVLPVGGAVRLDPTNYVLICREGEHAARDRARFAP